MDASQQNERFEPVGAGVVVFEQPEPVEGPVRWLETPQDVMDFVLEDGVQDTIVVSRGGTTTFLVPALLAHVKGVVTLQGAPESHLGIVTREYGIPCVMGVAFDQGVRTSRGEVVPADGVVVRLDVSTSPTGTVLAEVGAPSTDEPRAVDTADPAQTEQVRTMLEHYRGEIPHGSAGDAMIRAEFETGVLQLMGESLRRDLTADEVNEWSRYAGWNMWDCLAARSTEGESGLIPRQEYEAVSFVQIWQRYPQFLRAITEAVGVDGLFEIGATARIEVGTKVNLHHTWSLLAAVAFGRGVTMDLGLASGDERTNDLLDTVQFARRLYAGIWGGGDMYASMRGYQAPLLGRDWLDRFHDEQTQITDATQREILQTFNASTELLSFLLHFDNRTGMADTGPYPTPDGGFMITRDHYIGEPVYSWSDVTTGLPFAVTQAMYFKPDPSMDVSMIDLSTLFTRPANYLQYLSGMAVYARDTWDTPMTQLRLLDDAELQEVQKRAEEAASALYPRIASMSKQEKVMAGLNVYYTDFLLPFARQAGMWDTLVTDHDFYELDPLASQAYDPLVTDGVAAELIPRLFITGNGYPPLGTQPSTSLS